MNRAKFTAVQVLGILLVCAGLGGIGSQLIPRSHAIPSVPLAELGLDLDHAEKSENVAASMPKFQIVGADGQDNAKKNIRLWDAMLKVRGSHLPNVAQQIGDCVSWGAAHAVDYLQAVQIVRGEPDAFKEAYPPYIYGISRVQVGKKHGSNFRGDGSIGAYAAEGLRDFGCLRSDASKVPPYSGNVAKEWGSKGAPDWAITEAKPFSVKTIAQVKSADEARDAICNGYTVTIASSWWGTTRIVPVDGRNVATRNTSWAHQQCLIGYDGSGNTPYFYVLNSWGDNAHPRPLAGEPPGGYWVRYNDIDRICSEGDSWALSSFEGFPGEAIDWDQLLRRPVSAVGADGPNAFENGGAIVFQGLSVLLVSLVLVVAGVCLFRWAATARKRMSILSGLALLLFSVGVANAQQPDFAVAASRTAEPIDWGAACERTVISESAVKQEKISSEVWASCAGNSRTREVAKSAAKHPQGLFFTAKWCLPCTPKKNHIVKNIVPLGWTCSEDEDADFRIVDVDKHPDMVSRYRVPIIPTLVYVDASGKEFDRITNDSNRPLTAPLLKGR